MNQPPQTTLTDTRGIRFIKQIIELSELQYKNLLINDQFVPEIKLDQLSFIAVIMGNDEYPYDYINGILQSIHLARLQKDKKKEEQLKLLIKKVIQKYNYIHTNFQKSTKNVKVEDDSKTNFYEATCIGFLASEDE